MPLTRAILQVPVLKTVWENMRERIVFREHEMVARYWRNIVPLYFKNEIERYRVEPKKILTNTNVIWQYWAQGLMEEQLPEVVKICFDSVDTFKGDYQVIRLTDDSIKDYLDLPDFVWEKRQNVKFKSVFFSDLLRVALLQTYGGIWLDATILLTGEIPKSYSHQSYFAFQRSELAVNKSNWKTSHPYYWNWHPKFRVNVLSSIFFGTKGEPVTLALLNLMLHYWKTQEKILNYFFFQILYDELMQSYLQPYKCEVVDDTLPHLLQSKIFGNLKQLEYQEILARQSMHKLTYFSDGELVKLRDAINIKAFTTHA